jgi:hypothetical protein
MHPLCSFGNQRVEKNNGAQVWVIRPAGSQARQGTGGEGFSRQWPRPNKSRAGTPVWFAMQLSPTTFGVFDAFTSEEDRQAHLAGNMAKALMSRVEEMLARPPSVEPVDVLAVKNQPA